MMRLLFRVAFLHIGRIIGSRNNSLFDDKILKGKSDKEFKICYCYSVRKGNGI